MPVVTFINFGISQNIQSLVKTLRGGALLRGISDYTAARPRRNEVLGQLFRNTYQRLKAEELAVIRESPEDAEGRCRAPPDRAKAARPIQVKATVAASVTG